MSPCAIPIPLLLTHTVKSVRPASGVHIEFGSGSIFESLMVDGSGVMHAGAGSFFGVLDDRLSLEAFTLSLLESLWAFWHVVKSMFLFLVPKMGPPF